MQLRSAWKHVFGRIKIITQTIYGGRKAISEGPSHASFNEIKISQPDEITRAIAHNLT